MTIDEDSTGAIWATWTQVSGDSTNGFTNTVYVDYSKTGGTGWVTPFVLPVSNPNPARDDISSIVAFAKNRIGVMWTDQSGWTERWQAAGGQIAELADLTQATAGTSGTATWTLNTARALGAWRTALKPAS